MLDTTPISITDEVFIRRAYLAAITGSGHLLAIAATPTAAGTVRRWTLPTAVKRLPRSRLDAVARRIITNTLRTYADDLRLVAVDHQQHTAIFTTAVTWTDPPAITGYGRHNPRALHGPTTALRPHDIEPAGITDLLATAGADLATARAALPDIRCRHAAHATPSG